MGKKTLLTHIRWMIRRDMPEVLAIEDSSYEWPWAEDDFIRILRQRNCIGFVIECGEKVLGFMIYELHKSHINVLNLVVHPSHRRCGLGTALVEKLKEKLSCQRRNRISLCVRESNVGAQLFFRACDLVAVKVMRSEYDDSDEDGFQMEFRIDGDYPGAKQKRRRVVDVDLTNRIGEMFRRK